MIVGGNIDGFTRVMTTTIALETSKGNLPLAIGLGLVLIGVILHDQRDGLGGARLVRASCGIAAMRDQADHPADPSSSSVALRAGDVAILRDVSLLIEAGPPTVLIGPNGSGKTTLIKLAMGLLRPTAGRIRYAASTDRAARRQAIVFQKPVMLRRSAASNVAYALKAAGRAADAATVTTPSRSRRPRRRWPTGRRGGSRAASSSAWRSPARLPATPRCSFLDEPTASLDPAATKAVEDIIAGAAAAGVKIVMATHDLGQARRLAGDIVFLANGRLVEHAPAAALLQPRPSRRRPARFLAGELVI